MNSFGYGGSNAHVVVEECRGVKNHVSSYSASVDDLFAEDDVPTRPYLLVFSANDEQALRAQFSVLDRHLSDPAVRIRLRDFAHSLSERRSRHYHRGFVVSETLSLDSASFECGTVRPTPPRIGFVFTGQGAQWPEMGRDLLRNFPIAARHVKHLDQVLRCAAGGPTWSLFGMKRHGMLDYGKGSR